MLNWAECEAGLPGQPPLPGIGDEPTRAERVFIRLAQRWHEGLANVERNHPPPRAVDEFALAALLLAREHGGAFTNVAWRQVGTNISLGETRRAPWVDQLPWRLAYAARLGKPGRMEIGELVGNLNHHNSQLRIWMMELGWMVRPWLERETALPLLLENVAGTLGGVVMAWGLAGALFDSVEQFHAAAVNWEPEDFAEQYAERLVLLKDRGLVGTQAAFWMTEATCRRLIADEALSAKGIGPWSLL